MVERTLQKSYYWGFSGRRLRVSEPESPACKGRRLWLWTGDSGQRIRPPKLGFDPSGASLCCLPGVFEKGLRGLRGLCSKAKDSKCLPNSVFTQVVQASVASLESLKKESSRLQGFSLGSRRLRPLQAGDSRWHRRLWTPKSGDSGVSRPPMARFLRGV
jgi:hypothetical protein